MITPTPFRAVDLKRAVENMQLTIAASDRSISDPVGNNSVMTNGKDYKENNPLIVSSKEWHQNRRLEKKRKK